MHRTPPPQHRLLARLRFLGWLLLLVSAVTSPGRAAAETPEDLAAVLEAAVEKARAGDYNEAVRITNAAAVQPADPRKAMDKAAKIQEIYASLERLGPSDEVERVSMRFVGESFLRLRVVDKREHGVVLWTFIGYRFKGRWFCEGIHISGNSDLMELMRKELDAADARLDGPTHVAPPAG